MREVTCPNCGSVFVCTHDDECFCAKYELSEGACRTLQRLYDECLCEQCLSQYADKSKDEPR
ncbi:MAG: cysteine-rich CWC family protein [Bacteroidales bacterium]|jgi:hypothetical protein|nr:cysteine-rich CWC family protein [Bacteroidales bacterium]